MRKKLLGALLFTSAIAFSSLTSCSYEDKIAIALECNYAPFNWTSQSESEHTLKISNRYNQFADGYDIQIAKKIGEKLNKEVVIIKTAWESLIPDLQTKSVDLVIAGMTNTEERRKSIDFSNEYYRSELVLITKLDDASKFTEALSNEQLGEFLHKKVLVSQSFTVTDEVIDIFSEKYGAIHAKALDSFANAATDIKNGSAFAMTSELPVAKSIVAANPTLGIVHIDQEVLGEKASELGVSIGIRKGNKELQEKVNEALSEISIETRVEIMMETIERNSSGKEK